MTTRRRRTTVPEAEMLADEGDARTWAYWQPLPPAFWGADTVIQQEIIHAALQQAWPLLQQRVAAAGLTTTGTPRVRISIEVDTQAQP